MDCAHFRQWICHFQADEVPEDQRGELQSHLNDCQECQQRLAVEEDMLGVVRSGLQRAKAPPGLETRVRAAGPQSAREQGGRKDLLGAHSRSP